MLPDRKQEKVGKKIGKGFVVGKSGKIYCLGSWYDFNTLTHTHTHTHTFFFHQLECFAVIYSAIHPETYILMCVYVCERYTICSINLSPYMHARGLVVQCVWAEHSVCGCVCLCAHTCRGLVAHQLKMCQLDKNTCRISFLISLRDDWVSAWKWIIREQKQSCVRLHTAWG